MGMSKVGGFPLFRPLVVVFICLPVFISLTAFSWRFLFAFNEQIRIDLRVIIVFEEHDAAVERVFLI